MGAEGKAVYKYVMLKITFLESVGGGKEKNKSKDHSNLIIVFSL